MLMGPESLELIYIKLALPHSCSVVVEKDSLPVFRGAALVELVSH